MCLKKPGSCRTEEFLNAKEFDYGEIYRETGKCPAAFGAEII